jgi:hypothetical protein
VVGRSAPRLRACFTAANLPLEPETFVGVWRCGTAEPTDVREMKRVPLSRIPTPLDPETTSILVQAFDAAWSDLATAGCEAALGPDAQAARERLARRIVAQAQRGIRDPLELMSDGVAHVLSAAAKRESVRKAA